MTDKEKIEQILSRLENGYDFNPSSSEPKLLQLDMEWLINCANGLLKNNDGLRENNRTCRENNKRARRENKRYKQALEFYADENNNHNKIDLTIREYELMSPVVKDSGKIARKALEGEE